MHVYQRQVLDKIGLSRQKTLKTRHSYMLLRGWCGSMLFHFSSFKQFGFNANPIKLAFLQLKFRVFPTIHSELWEIK